MLAREVVTLTAKSYAIGCQDVIFQPKTCCTELVLGRHRETKVYLISFLAHRHHEQVLLYSELCLKSCTRQSFLSISVQSPLFHALIAELCIDSLSNRTILIPYMGLRIESPAWQADIRALWICDANRSTTDSAHIRNAKLRRTSESLKSSVVGGGLEIIKPGILQDSCKAFCGRLVRVAATAST